jgi:hypothetical protein
MREGSFKAAPGEKNAHIPARPYFILGQGKRSSNNQKGQQRISQATIVERAIRAASRQNFMECGGLPPLSPKLHARQQNDPGEACLACRPSRRYKLSG